MIRVTIWNENKHEKELPAMQAIYPRGLHGVLQEILSVDDDLEIRIATQDMPACGLPDEVLDTTDVLIWWGHCDHHNVPDEKSEAKRS